MTTNYTSFASNFKAVSMTIFLCNQYFLFTYEWWKIEKNWLYKRRTIAVRIFRKLLLRQFFLYWTVFWALRKVLKLWMAAVALTPKLKRWRIYTLLSTMEFWECKSWSINSNLIDSPSTRKKKCFNFFLLNFYFVLIIFLKFFGILSCIFWYRLTFLF